jgi:hypothetical protein
MTINEFRKLNRKQLTEMLVEQSKQIDSLKVQLKAAEEALEERDIKLNEAGNIAEAALKLNNIFEDAQAACEQYVYSLRAMYAREHEICRMMEEQMKGSVNEQALKEKLAADIGISEAGEKQDKPDSESLENPGISDTLTKAEEKTPA